MSRKYASMQEELAARKAAGEYGDLSQYEKRFFRNAPEWVKKSREEAARSEKAARHVLEEPVSGHGKWSFRGNAAAEKRAAHSSVPGNDPVWTEAPSHSTVTGTARQKSSAARQKAHAAKQKTRAPKQKPLVREVPRANRSNRGCLLGVVILLIFFPLVSALFAVIADIIHDFSSDYGVDYDFTYEEPYEVSGELSEDSSFIDAEAFAAEQTGCTADNDALINWYYSGGYYNYLQDTDVADITDGRLFLWVECKDADDPGLVIAEWAALTDTFRSDLDAAGFTDVPVCIIATESEGYRLRFVMIDGAVRFGSEQYENFVQ